MSGTLYIVSTPIGNLKDITLRALDILKNSDYILAESSARTSKLLHEYNIEKKIITFNKDNEKKKSNSIKKDLNQGGKISLVTDAGTPSVSDPGFELVRKMNSKYDVIPIPGPSSLTCAISVSEIPMNNFIFVGFLPKKMNEKKRKIQELAKSAMPIVIFENKHRLKSLIQLISEILGESVQIGIMRELTKLNESITFSPAKKALRAIEAKNPQGEIVLIVEAIKKENSLSDTSKKNIRILLKKFSPKEVVDIIRVYTNLDKRELYKYVLMIRQEL
ncbi:MAG: 16S rRNA (cytidine(1402)-2'-O)-methyltransferase [Gammaproteobacteria bacterium]|nr:16S rRNA (cytidine(1402)-2'-O)-methyltransferase [Gammaproteobacteria bacterium]|tara:strand:+ start:614 stop:1441 length:828 start_codon:yes stop_codon:yes gene_type:complete